jgi:hypothetical protein
MSESTNTAELRAKALELIRAGNAERDVADLLQIDLDLLRRLIGGPICPGCDE